MKILSCSLLTVLVVLVQGDNKFHKDLSEDHLTHYFGAKSVHEVPEYEITSPIKLEAHTSRYRRSSELVPHEHHPQFIVKAFDKEYHIALQRNEDLLSSGCLVQKHQKNGTREITSCLQGEDHCYYHGHVVNQNESSVAVSTCFGMQGHIRLPDHDLIIQPIKPQHINRVQRNAPDLPHIVYKRRSSSSDTCGVSEPPFQTSTTTRTKRATSGPYHMELRIVMAADATKYHGDDAKRYALTALNIAAQRFMDPSLGYQIHMAVVEVHLLQDDQPDLTMTDDSDQLLNNFCFWHEKLQPASESDNRFADSALLITKLDLQLKNDPSNIGLGHMGGVCMRNYRCSVNEDNGLDIGLTIAHETGHLLNMKHDGDGNTCIPGINIMSGKGTDGGHSSTQWSACSKETLGTFLSTSKSDCLKDTPARWAALLVNAAEKPGILYSGDEQCRLAMNDSDSKLCEGTSLTQGNECKMLVCYGPSTPSHSRSCYRGGPIRLDGTECGNRKWCIGGECVPMGAGAPSPINGGWSAWDTEWTHCSRSCGGGVKLKTRKCNNPEPRFGGQYCHGESVEGQLCNMKSCPGDIDYRMQQCAATNVQPLDGKTYNWLPYGNSVCALKCYDAHANIVDIRDKQYVDGTDCSVNDPLFRCVSGHCKKFGCDGHLNSGKSFDKCGVCGGQGSSCVSHTGSYNQGRAGAYVTFVTIPQEATGILITNRNQYCHMSVKVHGSLMFSSGTSISLSGKYRSNGLTVHYRRLGHTLPEKITIDGPTHVSLEVQVWRDYDDGYQGVKPEISYTYYTPIRARYSGYKWQATQSTCSRTCGTGHSTVLVKCISISSNSQVEDYHCDLYSRPQETLKECNTRPCPPQWKAEDWSPCSKSCGSGTMSRTVHCVIIQRDSYSVTSDSRCNLAHKPSRSQQCNTQPCPGVWKAGSWSTCSTTCGRGTRSRTVSCYESESSHTTIDTGRCSGQNKPLTKDHCVIKPCNLEITGDACVNKVDCTSYADNICEASEYQSWVRNNCAQFCGICAKDPSVYTCKDKLTNCDSYEAGFCKDYKTWAESNCQRTCGYCGDGNIYAYTTPVPCVDKVYCASYQKDTCTSEIYRGWAETHCRKYCGFCSSGVSTTTTPPTTPTTTEALGQAVKNCLDLVNCATYLNDICTELKYRKWASKNCNKHCGWCTTETGVSRSTTPPTTPTTTESLGQGVSFCVDLVNCARYSPDICTKSNYRNWASKNCNKHCGWCTTKTVITTPDCVDKVNCANYQKDICTNSHFSTWAHQHCSKHCQFCNHGHAVMTTHAHLTTTEAPGQADLSCVDVVNCAAYQSDICTVAHFQNWAHLNCRKHCGWCNTTTGLHTTPPPHTTSSLVTSGSQTCTDKVDCAAYQNDICTNTKYKAWAESHCMRFCGICNGGSSNSHVTTTARPSQTHGSGGTGTCRDNLGDCSAYQSDICTNAAYQSWAKSNCQKFCNLCDNGAHTTVRPITTAHSASSCSDKLSNCASYQSDICSNAAYKAWAGNNCKKFCGLCTSDSGCTDKLSDCHSYQDDICTNPTYKSWSESNCAKFCNMCGGSSDGGSTDPDCVDALDNCAEYQDDTCSNPEYKTWAKNNCAKHCKLCGTRRKRSVSDISTSLEHALIPKMKQDLPETKDKAPPKVPKDLVPNRVSLERVPRRRKYLIPESLPEKPVVQDMGEGIQEPLVPIPLIDVHENHMEENTEDNSKKPHLPSMGQALPLLKNVKHPEEPSSGVDSAPIQQIPGKKPMKFEIPYVERGPDPLAVPAPSLFQDNPPPKKIGEDDKSATSSEALSEGHAGQGLLGNDQDLNIRDSADETLLARELDALKQEV